MGQPPRSQAQFRAQIPGSGESTRSKDCLVQRSRAGLSVPSSSGKTLQPQAPGSYWTRCMPFQSPLHRGRLFNRKQSTALATDAFLSVPSSSGKTLQHQSESTVLSVPSSSGKTLQPIRAVTLSRYYAFSPLFIGEDSSTHVGTSTNVREVELFQSPLHRGRLFNSPIAVQSTRYRYLLSVPSSSGKTLQPLFIPCRFNNLQAVFYQIFRNGLICRKTRQVCENTDRMCVRAEH